MEGFGEIPVSFWRDLEVGAWLSFSGHSDRLMTLQKWPPRLPIGALRQDAERAAEEDEEEREGGEAGSE